MRDLHSHFLPGVDDGAKKIEVTKRMLESAYKYGVTDIMLTPHYIIDSKYEKTALQNEKIFGEIEKFAKNEYGINLFLGNEVYCNEEILDLLKKKKIKTLNDSRYILIEIPMYNKANNVKSIFLELISNGYVPILAHPERYVAYYNNIDFFLDLRNLGVLMQMNATSLVGDYGRHAKKMAVKLLKANLISFIGSDIHSDHDRKYEYLRKVEKKLKRIVGKEKYVDICINNFARVIKNDVVS